MKLKIKTFLIITIAVFTSNILSAPEYEIPTILRPDQPFNQPNNARLDYMNESSTANYKRHLDRKLKNHLNSEMVREFNVENFAKWVDFYTDENIHSKPVSTILHNISDILGKSLDLQSYVNYRSAMIVKELALFDMKLKQINVIDKAINNIKLHEGNIFTNMGNNLVWKEALDSVTLYASAADSDYSTKWSSLCEILSLEEQSTKQPISSKKVKRPPYSKMYNERGLIISKNDGGNRDDKADHYPPIRNAEKLQKALASLDQDKEIKEPKKKGREEEESTSPTTKEKDPNAKTRTEPKVETSPKKDKNQDLNPVDSSKEKNDSGVKLKFLQLNTKKITKKRKHRHHH